jgi:RIO-like serine/threonine protein kinase
MNSSFDPSYDSTMPEEFRLLCMLHNIGATTSEKSLPIEKISEWTRMEISAVQLQLQRLVELDFVQRIEAEGVKKYHITLNGIRKVLSTYS